MSLATQGRPSTNTKNLKARNQLKGMTYTPGKVLGELVQLILWDVRNKLLDLHGPRIRALNSEPGWLVCNSPRNLIVPISTVPRLCRRR